MTWERFLNHSNIEAKEIGNDKRKINKKSVEGNVEKAVSWEPSLLSAEKFRDGEANSSLYILLKCLLTVNVHNLLGYGLQKMKYRHSRCSIYVFWMLFSCFQILRWSFVKDFVSHKIVLDTIINGKMLYFKTTHTYIHIQTRNQFATKCRIGKYLQKHTQLLSTWQTYISINYICYTVSFEQFAELK